MMSKAKFKRLQEELDQGDTRDQRQQEQDLIRSGLSRISSAPSFYFGCGLNRSMVYCIRSCVLQIVPFYPGLVAVVRSPDQQ